MIKTLQIKTNDRVEFIDITDKIEQVIRDNKIKNGVMYIFIPHTTAGITINENSDNDVLKDIKKELNKIVPFDDNYLHFEGNSAAHIKASLLGFSETVIIEDGRLLLGTWQSIYFCEFDGKRIRKIIIKILS